MMKGKKSSEKGVRVKKVMTPRVMLSTYRGLDRAWYRLKGLGPSQVEFSYLPQSTRERQHNQSVRAIKLVRDLLKSVIFKEDGV